MSTVMYFNSIFNSCNTGKSAMPDMYAQCLRECSAVCTLISGNARVPVL